jgi:hypothetical protein
MATSVPLPLAPNKGLWYPTPDKDTPEWLKRALRKAFDAIYQTQGQLLPTGVFAVGAGTIVVTQAPNWSAIPGCSITLPRAGLWTAFGSVTFDIKDAGDLNFAFLAGLVVTGLAASTQSTRIANPSARQSGSPQVLVQSQPTQITVSGVWQFNVVANAVAVLQAQKDKLAPNTLSQVDAANSMIGAVWCGT